MQAGRFLRSSKGSKTASACIRVWRTSAQWSSKDGSVTRNSVSTKPRAAHPAPFYLTNPVAAIIRSTEEKTMKNATAITCVFLDSRGVLLTKRWDHHARMLAVTTAARPATDAMKTGRKRCGRSTWRKAFETSRTASSVTAAPARNQEKRVRARDENETESGGLAHAPLALVIVPSSKVGASCLNLIRTHGGHPDE